MDRHTHYLCPPRVVGDPAKHGNLSQRGKLDLWTERWGFDVGLRALALLERGCLPQGNARQGDARQDKASLVGLYAFSVGQTDMRDSLGKLGNVWAGPS